MTGHVTPTKVIANAADAVEVLAESGTITAADLAERLGIPRTSVYRLIDGLVAISLVEQLGDGRVRLSARWLRLADAAQASMSAWSIAESALALEPLMHRTGHTAFLSVLAAGEAVCIDWRGGRGVDVMALKPGRALPLYAGAAGRVMLAHAVDVDAYLASSPFEALTPYTLIDARALEADVARTRERGYVLSEQDVTVGISALGVPVFHPDGSFAACVSLGGLTDVFPADVSRLHEELMAASERLALGLVRSL